VREKERQRKTERNVTEKEENVKINSQFCNSTSQYFTKYDVLIIALNMMMYFLL